MANIQQPRKVVVQIIQIRHTFNRKSCKNFKFQQKPYDQDDQS